MENEEKNKNTSNHDLTPYKKDVFELYCLWKSLPSFFRFPPKGKDGKQPTPKEFVETMGIESDEIIELAQIRYQKDFAEKYNVLPDTLSDWNKTQQVRDSLSDIRAWARSLSKNVLMALYNKAIRNGFAVEVKLFFQLIEGWEEKQRIEHNYKGIESITIIKNGKTENPMGTDSQANGSMGISN